MEDDAILAALERRLGRIHARQRLGIEADHEARVFGEGIGFIHLENWYSAPSVVRNSLRAVGLLGRARRNALDIRIEHQDWPLPKESLLDAELVELVVNLICAGTGGSQQYTGMSMLEAHKGMNVSEAEFVAVLDDILAALDKHNVGEREKAELLAIAYSMKPEIVHV